MMCSIPVLLRACWPFNSIAARQCRSSSEISASSIYRVNSPSAGRNRSGFSVPVWEPVEIPSDASAWVQS